MTSGVRFAIAAIGLAAAAGWSSLALAQASQDAAPVRSAVPGSSTVRAAPGPTGKFPTSGESLRPTATLGPGSGSTGGASASGSGAAGATAAGATAVGATSPVPPRFPGMARFMSVAAVDAVLYDAPSERAKKIFLAPAGMPVEVVSVLRNWVKVRDAQGDLTWVLRDDLTDKRTVIVNAVAPLRREPQPMAASWFNLDQGVVVDLVDERPTNGFVRVRYAEGQIGWLQPAPVGGL